MNNASPLRSGWIQFKKYGPSVLAAGLIYGGIDQILAVLRYPLSNYVVEFVNFIVRQSFPDRLPLSKFGMIPWRYELRLAAIGVIVVVVGTFIGLWVQIRSQRHPVP
ncbi:MAG TPA: hypothetical protein VMD76_02640 [Candidatus Sulfotelmatobacter sp.]|nr:hypothetical protein [Candidatus Sulfotelmatobacter sp.]